MLDLQAPSLEVLYPKISLMAMRLIKTRHFPYINSLNSHTIYKGNSSKLSFVRILSAKVIFTTTGPFLLVTRE